MLVSRRYRVVYHQAIGTRDAESGSALRRNAIFSIASQTRAPVSAGIQTPQERDELLISDPLGRFLPEFSKTGVAVATEADGYEVVPAKRPITLRDLQTHTAGISYGQGTVKDRWEAAGVQGWYFADREEPGGETIARMASLPFYAQPGERWVHAYNTDILGAVAERARGKPLDVTRTLTSRKAMPVALQRSILLAGTGSNERPTLGTWSGRGSTSMAPA